MEDFNSLLDPTSVKYLQRISGKLASVQQDINDIQEESLQYSMGNLERFGRKLVEAQIMIEKIKNHLEEQYQCKPANPVYGELFYDPGPPKKLKIVTHQLFPPRIYVSAGLEYKPYKYYQINPTQDIWDATISELYHQYTNYCHEMRKIEKAIIFITYYYPNTQNYNVSNLNNKVIIYSLSSTILFCAQDNRRTTIIVNGKTDKEKPRTEIVVTEDLGQLKFLDFKSNNNAKQIILKDFVQKVLDKIKSVKENYIKRKHPIIKEDKIVYPDDDFPTFW